MSRPRASLQASRRASCGAFVAIILLFVFMGVADAAPLQHDLGEGLAYHRLRTLPADLPAATAKAQPIVLDLRFTSADDSAATALMAWLEFRASRAAPVFTLVNAETPPALHGVFAALAARPGFITIGSPTTGFIPDISISTPLDAERRAYDALDHGASIESLIRQNTDKPRMDEAAIMRERTNPPEDIPEDELTDAAPAETKTENAPPAPAPAIDFALQRAVQLHRALLALKRLER